MSLPLPFEQTGILDNTLKLHMIVAGTERDHAWLFTLIMGRKHEFTISSRISLSREFWLLEGQQPRAGDQLVSIPKAILCR